MCDLSYFLLLFVFSLVSCEQEDARHDINIAPGSLVLASVIYRHGDRTPIDPYPLDPYRNLSYWPVGWGQLTNKGKEQHYDLGKWLRHRYSTLLPEVYTKEDIQVRSTDVDRTLMSAASNLAGLYPPTQPQLWNKDVAWQPIPIHTLPETMDELLAAKRPCPRYDWELKRVKNSPEMQKINKDNAALYDYLTTHSGRDVHDIQGVEYIFNTLYIENLVNFSLPEWTKSVFPSKMSALASLSFSVPAMTQQLQRLKSGPLLSEIIQHMKHKSKNSLTPNRKMFMYSAHDTTVANMLMTLGVFDIQNPPYTATILIELRKVLEGDFVVAVWFRNVTGREPYLLTVPGCTALCPLGKFVRLTQPVIPVSWEEECQTTMILFSADGLAFNPTSLIGLIGLGVVAILLVICSLGLVHIRQRRAAAYSYHRLPASHTI